MAVMNNFATTFYFKEIFPTFTDFNNFVTEHYFANYGGTITEADHQYFYKILYNQYANSNIRYMTKDAFKLHFAVTYNSVVGKYAKINKILAKAYALTDNDLLMLSKAITNISNNDNTQINNPLEYVADFITQQNASAEYGNKLLAFMTAIDNFRDGYMDAFIDEFRQHFIQILDTRKKEIF